MDGRDQYPGTPLKKFRSTLLLWMLISLVLAAVSVFGWFLLDPIWAAIAAVLTAILLATSIGLGIAFVLASDYSEDRTWFNSRLRANWGYLSGAVRWGLAGGGVGALLATALPPRLLEAFVEQPTHIPITGWVAITFAALGIAIGILEERHSRSE